MTRCDVATVNPAPQIARTAIIGNPYRPLLDGRQLRIDHDTVIEAGVWIGHYTTIGEGVKICADSILEDFVGVQARTFIGSRVLVSARSWLGIGVTVNNDSVVKGHIGDNSWIGAHCRVSGDLIHRQLDPSLPWDDPAAEESAPTIENGAFIGWRAVIVGGVKIGAGAYVCAGALITRDVPAGHIAWGRNQIVHPRDWRGELGKSPFFHEFLSSEAADCTPGLCPCSPLTASTAEAAELPGAAA